MAGDDKTIGVTIRFYTDNLTVEAPTLSPKAQKQKAACWESGNVHLMVNKGKGIKPGDEQFQCLEDIIPAIRELFRKNHILMVSQNRRPRMMNPNRKVFRRQ